MKGGQRMQDHSIDEALSRLHHTAAPESFETGWRAAVRREELLKMTEKKKSFKRFWRIAVPALCALVLVIGGLHVGQMDQPAASMPSDMVMMSRSSSKLASNASYDAVYEEAAYDTGYAMTSGSAGSTYGSTAGTNGSAAPAAQENRKLVRTADLSIRTTAFDQALENAQTLLADMGGYVESLYQYGETTRRISLTMRVPSGKLDEFLSGAEGLGRVTDRSESTTDMTTRYVDNQARLNTLYAKRDRLNELLLKAEDVSDLIEIESAIADTQYQIDSYESTQRSIDSQVDMSAVTLTLIEEKPADTAQADVSLLERMRAAFAASVEWTGEFVRDVAVFIVMILPVAVPVGVIALVIVLIRRRKKMKEV